RSSVVVRPSMTQVEMSSRICVLNRFSVSGSRSYPITSRSFDGPPRPRSDPVQARSASSVAPPSRRRYCPGLVDVLESDRPDGADLSDWLCTLGGHDAGRELH